MTELFWPGNYRAGELLTDDALTGAMVRVEAAWLAALHAAGLAPRSVALPDVRPAEIADHAEAGGNPVIPLVRVLRDRLDEPMRAWLHRGLTSQDVLDTALMLCVRDAANHVLADIARQVTALRGLAERYRDAVQAGRSLTQHAVPTTFGLTAATWLSSVLDAADDLAAARERLPVQLGGAAGTQAAIVALGGDPAKLVVAFGRELGLVAAPPWHTRRRPVTRVGDAMLAAVDAFGGIANDVLTRSRPEIGELSEAAPGGSSTMPHKQNPVLSVLIKRAAIVAPFVAGQLHAAAAATVDERPDGAWHVEWSALRGIGRLAVVAASQTAELVEGLIVHRDRMRETAVRAADGLLAEARSLRRGDSGIESYLGATDALIQETSARATRFLKERQ